MNKLLLVLLWIALVISSSTQAVDKTLLCDIDKPIDSAWSPPPEWMDMTMVSKSDQIWNFSQTVVTLSGPHAIDHIIGNLKVTLIDAAFHVYPDPNAVSDDLTNRMRGLAFVFSGKEYHIIAIDTSNLVYVSYTHKEAPFMLKSPNGPIYQFNFGRTVNKIDAALFKKPTREALLFVDKDIYLYNMSVWSAKPSIPTKSSVKDVIGIDVKVDAAYESGDQKFVIISGGHYCMASWEELGCDLKPVSDLFACDGDVKTSDRTKSPNDTAMTQLNDSQTMDNDEINTESEVKSDEDSEQSKSSALPIIIAVVIIVILATIAVAVVIVCVTTRKKKNSGTEHQKKSDPEKHPKVQIKSETKSLSIGAQHSSRAELSPSGPKEPSFKATTVPSKGSQYSSFSTNLPAHSMAHHSKKINSA